jgi:ABC-2 type transport system ATP-binding protein
VTALAIHTEQLTRTFKGIRAVDRLTLKMEVGTVYGLLGPAGAGKTTVARLLLGLLEPTAGNARVLGFDTRTAGAAIRSRTGALLDGRGLYSRLNAEANLAFYADIWRLPSPDRTDRIRDLLLHFGLWERRREPVADLSQGMQQKLAIARTLLHRPALLLLDEPTLGLDAPAADALRTDLIGLAADEGVTIFVLSASAADVSHLCHRVGVIYQGRLVAEGQPQAMLEMSTQRLEVIGNGFTDDIVALIARRREVKQVQRGNGGLWIDLIDHAPGAPVVNLLVESGAEVEEVHRQAASLDMLYHSFTQETDVPQPVS